MDCADNHEHHVPAPRTPLASVFMDPEHAGKIGEDLLGAIPGANWSRLPWLADLARTAIRRALVRIPDPHGDPLIISKDARALL